MVRQLHRRRRTGQRPTPAALLLAVSLAICLGVALFATGERSVGPSVLVDGRRQAEPQNAAVLRFEILQTERTGPTGRLQSSTARTVAAGATTTLYAVAGRSADADLCDAGFVQDPSKGQAAYSWQVDAAIVAVSATQTTLDIRWARSRRDQSGVHEEDGETARLTLASRDWRLLDYVRAPADSPSACSSLALRIQAEPRLQAAPVPPERLSLDLWLTYAGPTGPRVVHRRANAESGGSVPLAFEPLRWSANGTPVAADYEGLALAVDVGGTVMASLQPDGLVDVSIDVSRSFQFGQLKTRGGGRQSFRCATDEVVELILPDPPSAEASTPLPVALKGTLADGVTVRGENVFIAPARFLSGGRLSVFVQVHRDPRVVR